MKISARIPEAYILVDGCGQSDIGEGVDPWETTSFDEALYDARISNFNIVKYSSVLPVRAYQISLEEAKKRNLLHHGMVLESIIAQTNGLRGDHICAGLGVIKVVKKTATGKEVVGGFVAEYEGDKSPSAVKENLKEVLEGIFHRRYRDSPEYEIVDDSYFIKDMVVTQKYGTVLVAIGFVSFVILEVKD